MLRKQLFREAEQLNGCNEVSHFYGASEGFISDLFHIISSTELKAMYAKPLGEPPSRHTGQL